MAYITELSQEPVTTEIGQIGIYCRTCKFFGLPERAWNEYRCPKCWEWEHKYASGTKTNVEVLIRDIDGEWVNHCSYYNSQSAQKHPDA